MKRIRSGLVAAAIMLLVSLSAQAQDADASRDLDPRSDARSREFQPEGEPILSGIVVNSNADTTDATPGDGVCETVLGNGICTLRAAIAEANAAATVDIITFDPSVTQIQVSGQLAITSSMRIVGHGPGSLTIQNVAALSTTSRVFNITNFNVFLVGMTITGGNVTGNGGGIQNIGTLTIMDCVISGNNVNGAGGTGGGVRSTNNLTVYNSTITGNASVASTSGGVSFAGANLTVGYSTISGNTSFGNGGGMNAAATATALVHHTTISGNTAGASSGGMFLNRGIVHNTTISGNAANGAVATDGGGALRIQAGANTVAITSTTITANTAPNAAAGARSGIWHETGTLTISNSIVAANVTQDMQRDGTGVISGGNHNLIGENTGVAAEFPAGSPNGTNYVGTDAAPIDPMIGPLANNGGPTQTHALLASSIAIDKGNSMSFAADQRRFFRLVDLPTIANGLNGDGGDIGAYEFQSTDGVGVTVAGQVARSAGGSGVAGALVTLTDTQGGSQIAITNPFGNFRFDNVPFGRSYIVRAEKKGLRSTMVFTTPDVNVDLFVGMDEL